MLCPKCGGVTRVEETRDANDQIVRRRVCKVCKHRFMTAETVIEFSVGLELLTIGRRNLRSKA